MGKVASIKQSKAFLYAKYILFFVFTGAIFFIYQRHEISNSRLNLVIILVSLILFIISVINFKYGLYFFIFLVPLLNSIPNVLKIENKPVILFVFFGLVLGYLMNKILTISSYNSDDNACNNNDRILNIIITTFVALFTISAAITIFRYSNFFPFITDNYHQLIINVNGIDSTYAIFWTINFFFNYLVGFVLLYFVIKTLRSKDDIKNSIFILISSTIVSSMVLIYQYFFNPYWGNSEAWVAADRFNATFNDPNSLGSFTVLLFPIFIFTIFYLKKWYQKIILILFFLPFLFVIFASGSRNAFIGIFLSLLAMIVIGIKELVLKINTKVKSNRSKAWIWGTCGLVIVLVVILLSSFLINLSPDLKEIDKPPKTSISLIDRMVDTVWMAYNTFFRADLVEAFNSVSSYRYALWDQATEMFKDHPFTGVGLGSFIFQLPNYYVKNNSNVNAVDFTGNYYLQLLSELGIMGLVLVLAIFFLIFRKAYLFYRDNYKLNGGSNNLLDGLVISFIAMIGSLFLGPHTNFFEIQFVFWIILSLIIIYANQGSKHAKC